jgi:hypothetical protein
MSRLAAVLLLIGIAVTTTACIVDPGPGPGHDRWCYWHPDRCR